MKITLEVLKEKGASELDIAIFEGFCSLSYINKKECEPVELVRKFFLQNSLKFFNYSLAFRCIDTIEELRAVIDWQVQSGWEGSKYGYILMETLNKTIDYCVSIYKQDLDLFKKVVGYYLKYEFDVSYITAYCGEVLEMLPELHEKLKDLVESKDALYNNVAKKGDAVLEELEK